MLSNVGCADIQWALTAPLKKSYMSSHKAEAQEANVLADAFIHKLSAEALYVNVIWKNSLQVHPFLIAEW